MRLMSCEQAKHFRFRNLISSNSRIDNGRAQVAPLDKWNRRINSLDGDKILKLVQKRAARDHLRQITKLEEPIGLSGQALVNFAKSVTNYGISEPVTYRVWLDEVNNPTTLSALV